MTSSFRTLLRVALGLFAITLVWLLVGFELGVFGIVVGVGITLVVALLVLDYFLTNPVSPSVTPVSTTPTRLGDAATILSLLDDAVIAYDRSFQVIFANDAATRLFGVTAEELRTLTITPKIAQDNPRLIHLVQTIYPSLAPLVTPRSEHIVDLVLSEPALDLRVTTLPLGDTGFLKVIRDRTRQKAIIRSKGEFVTVASHQLRTPLTEVSWALETLTQSPTMGPDDKAIAAQTLDSVKSLVRTAEDLLGVAKIEEGRFGYHVVAENIVAVLDTELGKALPIVENTGLKLFFDRPTAPLPAVYIDKDKVAMVVNNLVENAMRYNVASGEITVKAEAVANEPYVKVSVRDTGIGIAQADIDKLFTKFFRADNAVKAVAGGTGLGLYIASNIIRAHGGQMGVVSELGRGTTFWFTLATDQSRVPQHEVGEDL